VSYVASEHPACNGIPLNVKLEDCSSELTIRKHWSVGTSKTLGISLTPLSYEDSVWQQEAGPTVFAPFEETSDYFGDAHKFWMVNFRDWDLAKMAAQLQAEGITVKIDPQSFPNGRFARLHDPEGNPIELWQPKVPDRLGCKAVQDYFWISPGLRGMRKLSQ